MTQPTIRLKVRRQSVAKGKALVKFPASVATAEFLTVTRSGGTYTFDVDYTLLAPTLISDPTTSYVAYYNAATGAYSSISVTDMNTGSLDADLQAIAALTGTGIARRTGTNTWSLGTAVANSELATMANNTFKGNVSGSTAVPSDLTAAQVTAALPVATTGAKGLAPLLPNDATKYLDGTGNYTVPGGSGVSNFAIAPGGRVTLATGVPVMATSQAGRTTVYYTPYAGNLVPIYDGTNMTPTAFTELSQATTDATKSPAAVAASKVYDLFVWSDGGTIRCTRGPAWTNATTRGYTLTMTNGIFLNTSLITNGPAALRGTWVGTIASNASSTIDFIFGASGSGGVAAVFNVWNAYNRVSVGTTVVDTGASYSYTSSTWRQARASAGMQVSFVVGAAEDAVIANNQNVVQMATSASAVIRLGIGYDSITVPANNNAIGNNAATALIVSPNTPYLVPNPAVGTHYISAMENADGTNGGTFNLGGAVSTSGLEVMLRM